MELNMHYKNIQDATKAKAKERVEEKLQDALKQFGSFEETDAVDANAHLEYFEKHNEFTVRVQLRVHKKGKEYSFVVEKKKKDDLLGCVDDMKLALHEMIRKEKE